MRPHSEYCRVGADPSTRSTWAPGVQDGSGGPPAGARVSAATPSATSSFACTTTSVTSSWVTTVNVELSASVTSTSGSTGADACRDGPWSARNRSGRRDQTYMLGVVA